MVMIYKDKIKPIETPLDKIKMKSSRGILVLDIESYPNYILVGLYKPNTGLVHQYELHGWKTRVPREYQEYWKAVMENYCLITLNGHKYDIPVLEKWSQGDINVKEAFQMSERVFEDYQEITYTVRKSSIAVDHIDLLALYGGMRSGGLKSKAINICCPRVKELPITAGSEIEDTESLREYNRIDLYNTGILLANSVEKIKKRLPLIKIIHKDVRDHSDSECGRELFRPLGERGKMKENNLEIHLPKHPNKWNNPIFQSWEDSISRIKIQTEPCVTSWGKTTRDLVYEGEYEDICRVRGGFFLDGRAAIPKGKTPKEKAGYCQGGPVSWHKEIGTGSGGVHFAIDKTIWSEDDKHEILEMDVSSYYPALILKQQGKYLSDEFYQIYRQLYDDRILLKKTEKTKAESYKIILNSVFGRLKYYSSITNNLCNFELYLNVVHPGHYYIFRLMDSLEALGGVKLFYMNTDGIKVYLRKRKRQEVNDVIDKWKEWSGFLLPVNNAERVILGSVSDYFSMTKEDYSFSGYSLGPNILTQPKGYIIDKALINYFMYGTPVEDYVRQNHPKYDYMFINKCTNRTHFEVEEKPISERLIKYYYTKSQGNNVLRCGKNKSRIEKDNSIKLVNEIEDIELEDINYEAYVNKIKKRIEEYNLGGLNVR